MMRLKSVKYDKVIPKIFKTYRCPVCDKILFKGHVFSIFMPCPHCNKFICITLKKKAKGLNSACRRDYGNFYTEKKHSFF